MAVVAFVVLAVGPRTGKYRTMTVLSESMSPTYPRGSLVIAVPTPVHQVRPGDVITFHAPVGDRQVVTHRVVRVLDDPDGTGRPVVVTKGDASATEDPWEARLEGSTAWRVGAGVPLAGYALMFLHSAGRGLWLVFPALLAVVWLYDIWTGDRRGRRGGRRGHVAIVS